MSPNWFPRNGANYNEGTSIGLPTTSTTKLPNIHGSTDMVYEYSMPAEDALHEGTWLQWPHDYGANKRRKLVQRYEESWIQMTLALAASSERVHIVVYNAQEHERVQERLQDRGCDMTQVDFFEWPFEDVWVRDNGPIFVWESNSMALHVTNWEFNGWGGKYRYECSNQIPQHVATALDLPCINLPMVLEGGSIEVDGNGTLMAKRSSILNKNRNPGMTQEDAEAYFRQYLGVTNFIWLNGVKGQDITDDHIDGTARFANENTIVTYFREDFLDRREYDALVQAKNRLGQPYHMVHLPITTRRIVWREYGYYMNYYVGNDVVLVPSFDDPNDQVAADAIRGVYPTRRIVSIPMKEVLRDGGLVHCVTQQQPMSMITPR